MVIVVSSAADDHKGVGDSGANGGHGDLMVDETSSLSNLGVKGERKQPSTLEAMEDKWQGRDGDDGRPLADTVERAARHMEDQ